MKTALEILNQVEPNGELLDTDQALEAMELYAVEYAKSLKEDKRISVKELMGLLKESRDVLVMCSLIDRSNTCDKMVEKIDEKLKSVLPSPPKTEK